MATGTSVVKGSRPDRSRRARTLNPLQRARA